MKVCIVGHGYSLLNQSLGKDIDACEFVVRMKECRYSMQIPWSYGRKIDAHGFSYVARAKYMAWSRHLFPDAQRWVFPDTRQSDSEWGGLVDTRCEMTSAGKAALIMPEVSRRWISRYQEITEEIGYTPAQGQEKKGRLSNENGHKHFSQGMHAIIYACDLLKPSTIWLPGFDSLTSGKHSISIIRPAGYASYPDHNWEAERVMLKEVSSHYAVEVSLFGFWHD